LELFLLKMVRTVKSCSLCLNRFVSCGGKHNTGGVCLSCCSSSATVTSSGNAARLHVLPDSIHLNNTGTSTVSPAYKNNEVSVVPVPSVTEINCEHSTKMSGNGPGGCVNYDDKDDESNDDDDDDFHCTQIIELDDNNNHAEEERIVKYGKNSKGSNCNPVDLCQEIPPTKVTVTSTNSTNSPDVCFICGISLAKLKHRIDHIKRCSKKHGITGKDARLAVVDVDPVEDPSDKNEDVTNKNSWHGDAGKMLTLTTKPNQIKQNTYHQIFSTSSESRTIPSKTIATRNLNNVLMAGSRRLEIIADATTNRGDRKIEKGNKKRARYNPHTRKDDWKCPLYKKITGTDFVVDGFHYAKTSLTKNYFLSHYHSDHYGGINSSWDAGTIYCSLPTATLVSQQLRVDKKYLHPLVMNEPITIISRGKPVHVTLLDANHCPGAVMFLFEIGKRKILHVGDFRWSDDVMLQDPSSPLRKIASQKMVLDELYLDTTYCHEKYALPSQAEAIKSTITMFGNELARCKGNSSKRTLHLFGAYTIGKEKVYLSVAEHFGFKVYVDKARYRNLLALDLPEECMKLLTTNKELGNIWVVPMSHLNMKKLPDYFAIANSKPFTRAYDRIVGYRPTGWSLSQSGVISSRNHGNLAIHSVPYSEHSSFPELVDCLACLKPAKIIPTVNATKSEEQVQILLRGVRNRHTQTVLRFGGSNK